MLRPNLIDQFVYERGVPSMENWLTILIILSVAILAGIAIHTYAPGAVSTFFNDTLQDLLNAAPVS